MIVVSFHTTEYWCPVLTQIIMFASASIVNLSPHLTLVPNNKKGNKKKKKTHSCDSDTRSLPHIKLHLFPYIYQKLECE